MITGLWNLVPASWRIAIVAATALILVAGLGGACLYSYRAGYGAAAATCRANNADAAISWLRLQLSIAQAGSQTAERQAEELAARDMELQERLNAYEQANAADGAACILTDDDVGRLRDLVK